MRARCALSRSSAHSDRVSDTIILMTAFPAGRRAIEHLEHLSAFAEQSAKRKDEEGIPLVFILDDSDAFDAPAQATRVHQHGSTHVTVILSCDT